MHDQKILEGKQFWARLSLGGMFPKLDQGAGRCVFCGLALWSMFRGLLGIRVARHHHVEDGLGKRGDEHADASQDLHFVWDCFGLLVDCGCL